MKWKCDICHRSVKGDACPNCGAALPNPATTAATETMHRALRSVPFVLAVICFTLAVLLTVTLEVTSYQPVSAEQMNQWVETFEQVSHMTVPEKVQTALNESIKSNQPDLVDTALSYGTELLAVVGFWWLLAAGFRSGRIRRGGAVVLKIVTVVDIVIVSILMAVTVAVAALLLYGQPLITSFLSEQMKWEQLSQSVSTLFKEEWYTPVVWSVAGTVTAILLLELLFFIGALRTLRAVVRVSRFGQFQKVSVYLCVMLIIFSVLMLISGAVSAISLNLQGGTDLLGGLSMLLFAVTVLRYRRWSKQQLWSDIRPEGVDNAAAAIPSDLQREDLLGEAPSPVMDFMEPQPPITEEFSAEAEQPAEEEPLIAEDPPVAEKVPSAPLSAVDSFMQSAVATTVCPHCGAVMAGKAFVCEQCGEVL